MAMLSVLIPARHEEFLQHTVDDVFRNARGDVEVLVALDNWDNPPAVSATKVIQTLRGQRGATNALAAIASGDYLMKLDAHCSMAPGFDLALMEDAGEDVTIVPAICNLHAYDWVCPAGHRHFQGKYEACEQCGSDKLKKETVWQMLAKPIRSSFYFDTALHFQYCEEEAPGLVHDTMSIQGSCFMVSQKKYWELELCDEAFGSWGQQGTEVACKTWLSGGRVLCSKKAFYAHQFRETEGFPYPNPTEKIIEAQKFSRNLFLNNCWPKQVRSFQSLVEQFNFPGDWTPKHLQDLCTPFPTDFSKSVV